MLIVNASAPKGPEIAVQRHLKPLTGVLIGNAKIPRENGEAREVDAIVLTPSRVFVVEAKGFKGKTANTGVLEAPLNGDWTIGGEVAQFYGKDWPNVQARQSAQTLAGLLQQQTSVRTFVTAIASISAKDATMPGGPLLLADVMVCKDHDLLDAVAAMPVLGRVNKPIATDHVFETLRALGLPERMWPSRDRVEAEWAKAPQQEAPTTSSNTGRERLAAGGDERTFEQIMADARARRGGKTPQEETVEVMRRLHGQPSRTNSTGEHVLPLRYANGSATTTSASPADTDAASASSDGPKAKRMSAFGRLFWLAAAAVLVFGLVNKFVLSPDAGDMEDAFEAALSQAYPEAEGTLDVSSLACHDHEYLDVTTFYCGVLTRDADGQRWRYEADASEPEFLTADDVSREINDLGESTVAAERAESEALSQFRTEFPAKAKKITSEYVECKQGADEGTWPFKHDTFDCFGFDAPAGKERYRYEVSISGDEPIDFKIGTVYRDRERA